MYKLTRLDGMDFYSGTVDYAGSIGKIIRITDYDTSSNPCGRGLHASRNPNDCFIGAKIPCRAFRVKGINRLAGDKQKSRYKALKIIAEIKDLNKLFGWNYTEAINPIHPFKIKPPKITENEIALLKVWDSVGDSVRGSVGDSVRASIWDSVRGSVGVSVGGLVGGVVGGLVWDSVGDSVGGLVWDSVWGYIGSLFPDIKNWKYISHEKGIYPYQCCVDLWKQGLVPSYDGKVWRLHGGPIAKILFEFTP